MQPFDRQHTRCISNLSGMEVVHNISSFTAINNAFDFSGANNLLPIDNEKDFDIMFYDCSTLKRDKLQGKNTFLQHNKQIESNGYDLSTNYIKTKNIHQNNRSEELFYGNKNRYQGLSTSTPKMNKRLPSLPSDVTSLPPEFPSRGCKAQNTSKRINKIIMNDEHCLPIYDRQQVINQNCNGSSLSTNNCFPLEYKTKTNCNRYNNLRGFSSSPELQSNLEKSDVNKQMSLKDLSEVNNKLYGFSETKKKESFLNEIFDLETFSKRPTSSVVQTKMINLEVPSFTINGLSDNESEAIDDLDDSRHLIKSRNDIIHAENNQNNKNIKKKKKSIKLFRNLTDPVRFLPKTPKSSTGELKRKSLWRTNSDPIPFTKDKKTEKHRSFYYELKSHFSKKAKQEEKNVEEEVLIFDVFEQKKYDNALLRGRRGAVFSLEINQSISIIQTFPQQNKYSQFKFMSQNSSSIQNNY